MVFCRSTLSADDLPADPPSLPFRTVRGDVNFGLRSRFWLWVELPRSRTVLVAAYRLDGLPFYRQWSFIVCPAVTGDSGHRSLLAVGWRQVPNSSSNEMCSLLSLFKD